MKITLLSTFDRLGGASIAALRLQRGLRSLGQDSWMLVKQKSSLDPHVRQMDLAGKKRSRHEDAWRRIEEQVYEANRTGLSNTRFSLPYPGYDVSGTKIVREADIVNLHWVALFQSVESVSALLASGKPVVWTLHDQNPFSGGCHYSAGCSGYMGDCRDCPQLRDPSLQLPAMVLEAKKKFWLGNLTVVTPSRWLADCARRSSLFGKFRVEVIANSLEHEIYRPHDKGAARRALGLRPDCLYLLFSSYTSREKRKGFAHMILALQHCLRQERFRALANANGTAILLLGPCDVELKNLGIPLHPLGMIMDDERLALANEAADVMVIPSEEENLPNVMLEALACGTPVAGFAVGGMPDVVEDGVNGVLAAPGDAAALGEAILSLAFDDERRRRLGENGRRLIERNFKLSDQARNYLGLFEDLRASAKPQRVPDADRGGTAVNAVAINLAALVPDLFRGHRRRPRRTERRAALKKAFSRGGAWAKLVFLLRNSGFRYTCRFVWERLTARWGKRH